MCVGVVGWCVDNAHSGRIVRTKASQGRVDWRPLAFAFSAPQGEGILRDECSSGAVLAVVCVRRRPDVGATRGRVRCGGAMRRRRGRHRLWLRVHEGARTASTASGEESPSLSARELHRWRIPWTVLSRQKKRWKMCDVFFFSRVEESVSLSRAFRVRNASRTKGDAKKRPHTHTRYKNVACALCARARLVA